MQKIKLAVASAILSVICSAVSANAAVLYSISGVVGDANWTMVNLPAGQTGFEFRTGQLLFPDEGTVEVIYTGPAIVESLDAHYQHNVYEFYACDTPGGCPTGNLVHHGGDEGNPASFRYYDPIPVGATSATHIYDSTTYMSTSLDPEKIALDVYSNPYASGDIPFPPLCCEGARFTVYFDQVFGFSADDVVSSNDKGKRFSLTISAVPEPATWAMMLIGFGAVGFAMRSARQKSAALA